MRSLTLISVELFLLERHICVEFVQFCVKSYDYCFVGYTRDVTGSYITPFAAIGSLAIVSAIFITVSRLCLRKHRKGVFHPETGELENHEVIIK